MVYQIKRGAMEQDQNTSTAYAKRKPGRPPGAKNIPKALTIQMAQSLALQGVQLRASIDTGRHLKRLAELAMEIGLANSTKNWLTVEAKHSMGLELEILKRLLKLTLPDVAMIRSEAPPGEDDVLHGVVILPQLDSLTKDQPTSAGTQPVSAHKGSTAPGNGHDTGDE